MTFSNLSKETLQIQMFLKKLSFVVFVTSVFTLQTNTLKIKKCYKFWI